MITTDKIVSKLWNDGFRYGMDSAKALEILGRCVAPVACQNFYREHTNDIFDMLLIWARAESVEPIRVKRDGNGNSRFVVPHFDFLKEDEKLNHPKETFELALGRAREIGGRVYRGKDIPRGIVFQTTNELELRRDVARIRFYSKS